MTAASTTELLTYAVDPARLAHGTWCHRANKTLGQGDIATSYSGDRIGMDQPIRRPFEWQGSLWICVGSGPYDGVQSSKAYRLVHPLAFAGDLTTYRERPATPMRREPIPTASITAWPSSTPGNEWCCAAPPALFVPGQKTQLDLF